MAIRLIKTPINHSQTGRHDTRFNPRNKNRATPTFDAKASVRQSRPQKKMPGLALAFSHSSTCFLELHIVKKVLHPFKPGVLLRILLVTLLFLLKLSQQFFLPLGQVHWRFQHHPAHQVSRLTATHRGHPLAAQPEQFAGLGFRRNLKLDPSIQRRHFQLATQGRIGKADRHLAVEILAIAHKNPVFTHRDLHIQVTRRPTIDARLAFARQTDPITRINTRRHLHRQGFLLFHIACTMTGLTGCADRLARTTTAGTGLLYRKEPLLHPDLTGAMTGATSFRLGPRFRARRMAGTAFDVSGYPDLDGGTADRFFQVQLQGVAQITTPVGTSAPTAAEDVTEHIAKDITEAGAAAKATRTGRSRSINSGMTELVIGRPAVGIGQHLIGFSGFFELVFSLFITRVAVRVILHGETTIGLLDLFFVRRLGNTQYFVIIALSHSLSCHHQLPKSPLGYTASPSQSWRTGELETSFVAVLYESSRQQRGRVSRADSTIRTLITAYLRPSSLTSSNSASTTSSALPAPSACSEP